MAAKKDRGKKRVGVSTNLEARLEELRKKLISLREDMAESFLHLESRISSLEDAYDNNSLDQEQEDPKPKLDPEDQEQEDLDQYLDLPPEDQEDEEEEDNEDAEDSNFCFLIFVDPLPNKQGSKPDKGLRKRRLYWSKTGWTTLEENAILFSSETTASEVASSLHTPPLRSPNGYWGARVLREDGR